MRARRPIAGLSALALAFGVIALTATPASAAYDDFRPGAESPIMTSNSAWKPSPPTTRMAQPFIQPEDGRLASFSFEVNDIPTGHALGAAAVHLFTAGVGPAASPIAGGVGGTITYAPGTGTKIWATIEFPDRPLLLEDERYAIVIDPFGNADPVQAASFSIPLAFGGPVTAIRPWALNAGTWSAYGNAHHLIFRSELVTSYGETGTPTLAPAAQCGIEPTVVLPTSEGVVYTPTRVGDTVTVTATAADGYVMDPNAQTSWTFDVAATPCPDQAGTARLPATGAEGLGAVAFALLLLATGALALVAVRTRGRRA